MVKGFDSAKKNLNVTLNSIINNVAGNIAKSINTSEPLLKAKVERRSDDGDSLRVVIKGSAELPAEKKDIIKDTIEKAIQNGLGN